MGGPACLPTLAPEPEPTTLSPQNSYSGLDRILHRLAFSTIELQKALADIEDRLYASRFFRLKVDRPVFITSLPRAGTTLLLEIVASLDAFASHTYRDMPFLLTPMLWRSISRPFHKPGGGVERAHGDGMTVCYDSPEAFEELLWRAFWPGKYLRDRIEPWQADDLDPYGEFEPFMLAHVPKVTALGTGLRPARYVSKNNANMARIPKLRRLFPDAVILVPFRKPADHVGSMLRQHLRFLEIHARDEFARRYMEYMGHFDFGANFKPIDFGLWLDRNDPGPTDNAEFWLQYWCAAFEYILANSSEDIVLLNYDDCCANPDAVLRALAGSIGIDRPEALAAHGLRFRPSNRYDPDELELDGPLLSSALDIHRELQARSIWNREPVEISRKPAACKAKRPDPSVDSPGAD